MSKYKAEQVEAFIRKQENHTYVREDFDIDGALDYLGDYAALLRERESAKAGVTDEMATSFFRDIYGSETCPSIRTIKAFRDALEVIASMLASARAKQEPYCYTVEQKNGLSQGTMCRTKAECEASPLFDPDSDHIIPLYREPMLASARVPDSEWLELADVLDKFTPTGGPGPLWGAGASFAYSDAAKTIRAKLDAAPKPKTEE